MFVVVPKMQCINKQKMWKNNVESEGMQYKVWGKLGLVRKYVSKFWFELLQV
jgi:hypothetical protein